MTQPLWTLEAMVDAMGARTVGDPPTEITGISIDSRTIGAGDAYFAIEGDVHDGHKFVASSYANGGGLSIVAEEWLDRLEGETGPLLVVDDVLEALRQLARAARARSNAKIVAVTGSAGKTSTKEMLRAALSASGSVHAAEKSFNNHWGVPLTLARFPADAEFGVFEIGMNHPGEITPLVQMVRPHVAIITNVAAVHLGAFDSVDGIAHAKSEIFDGLEPGGIAVLNGDDERIALMEGRALDAGVERVVRFGEVEGCEARITKLALHASCTCMSATVLGHDLVVKIGVPGRHMAQNAAAVLAASQLAGADLAKAALALGGMEAVVGRGRQHLVDGPNGRYRLIDESYNANPASMRAALELLGATPTQQMGRRIAVLGDMLELGETSADLHAGLAVPIGDAIVDVVYLAGSEMKALADSLDGRLVIHRDTIDDLIPLVAEDQRAGDVMMVKASLGMRFARLVSHLLESADAES